MTHINWFYFKCHFNGKFIMNINQQDVSNIDLTFLNLKWSKCLSYVCINLAHTITLSNKRSNYLVIENSQNTSIKIILLNIDQIFRKKLRCKSMSCGTFRFLMRNILSDTHRNTMLMNLSAGLTHEYVLVNLIQPHFRVFYFTF